MNRRYSIWVIVLLGLGMVSLALGLLYLRMHYVKTSHSIQQLEKSPPTGLKGEPGPTGLPGASGGPGPVGRTGSTVKVTPTTVVKSPPSATTTSTTRPPTTTTVCILILCLK